MVQEGNLMFKLLFRVLVFGMVAIGLFVYLRSPQERPQPNLPKREPQQATQASGPQASFSPNHPRDFNEAKSILRKIYAKGQEFYCGCRYDLSAKKRIDASSCGYKGQGVRSQRIEWEHVVPASIFGRRFSEWTQGHPSCMRNGHMEKGRNCARSTSGVFSRMEGDLYNLLPTLGELNGARSNYAYGEIKGETREFGACDFEVTGKQAEPRLAIRGDLARIYFYMDARYTGFEIVNRQNEGLLTAWNRDDPIDEAERQRLQQIESVQGNSFFIGRLHRLASIAHSQ